RPPWCEEPGRRAHADRLPPLEGVPGRHAADDVRVPDPRGGCAATCLPAVRAGDRAPPRAPGKDDRRKERCLDPGVDRRRREMSRAGAARAVAAGLPAAFLAFFFVYPLGSILER